MQHPTNLSAERVLAFGLIDDCKRGDLPHTATTESRQVSPARTVDTLQKASLFGAHARVVYTQPAQHKDVTEYLIAAPAFAAWLAAQPEEPSQHIAAWFEAVGVNTQDQAAPVPTATPLIEQPTIWTDKRKREARAMLEKLKGEGKRAFHKKTAEHYKVSPQRLRDVLNDSGAPAPKKARGQNSVFDVKASKVHRIK